MQKRAICPTTIVVAVLLVATGCVSLPSPEVMQREVATYKLPKLPEPGKAIVYVVRPDWTGGYVRFNVFVDDQEATSEVGYTRGGQYIYFNIAPGEHKILSKAEDWARTTVQAEAGDIIYMKQKPYVGTFMPRNTILEIAEYEGKYFVKTLTLGTILKAEK